MNSSEKAIESAQKLSEKLQQRYNAPVVWMGGNRFIIVKDGREIKITEG